MNEWSLSLLMPYVKRYRLAIFFVLGATVVSVLAESLGLALFVPLLNIIFQQPTSPAEQGGILGLFSAFLERIQPDNRLGTALWILGGLAVVKAGALFTAQYTSDVVRNHFVSIMRIRLQEALSGFGYEYLTSLKPGNVLFSFTTEGNYLGILLAHYFKFITSFITAVIFLLVMLMISWQLTALALVFAGLIGFAVQFSVKKSREKAKEVARAEAVLTESVHQSMGAFRLSRSMGTETTEINRVADAARAVFRAVQKKVVFFNITLPLSELLGAFGLIVLIAVGTRPPLSVAPAEIFGMTLIIVRLLPYVSSLNQTRSQIGVDAHYALRFFQLLSPEGKPKRTEGRVDVHAFTTAMEFHDVSFSYANREEHVLKNISFTIPKGKTTAIVGESGSGKSTMLDLIIRLFDPTTGSIAVDGTRLDSINPNAWHRLLGVVSQDNFLFHATLRENLLYAKPNATEQEIEYAVRQANVHEFLSRLPEGLDTILGERGVLLSGGQRQRIAIARAILRNPAVLIFDEATSALDATSERAIQQALKTLARDRTIIIVAHRLTTVEHADNIIVLHEGAIVEEGTHNDLLQKEGYYASLYRSPKGAVQ